MTTAQLALMFTAIIPFGLIMWTGAIYVIIQAIKELRK